MNDFVGQGVPEASLNVNRATCAPLVARSVTSMSTVLITRMRVAHVSSILASACYLVPSSRIRLLATSVAAPLHPALSLAYRLMLLMVIMRNLISVFLVSIRIA